MWNGPYCYARASTALAIACVLAILAAQPAAAQNATNLRCNGCVDGKDIKNKSIGTNDIRNNAIKGSKVRNNSLTGADIRDGTIELEDLAPGVAGAIPDPGAITEVLVTFDDPAQGDKDSLRIAVEGVDLDSAADVTATLGEQGALQVVSFGGGEVLALCPAPDQLCQEGDYQLTVFVEPAAGSPATLTHDLTIGAVGPVGPQGPPGAANLAMSGEFIRSRHNTAGTSSTTMGSISGRFCFLTGVSFEDTDSNAEWAECRIVASGSNWVLQARLGSTTDADAWCRARCVTF